METNQQVILSTERVPDYDSSVYELKRILEPVVTACVLADENALLISKSGYGKTEIFDAMGAQIYGIKRVGLFTCAPGTQKSDISGYENPLFKVDPERAKANGLPEWVTANTVVDPSRKIVTLDELPRIGQMGEDELIHVMHEVSRSHRPVMFATANWLTPTVRNAALRDRFTFTIWYEPSPVDVDELSYTPEPKYWQYNLPTEDEIEDVQNVMASYRRNPNMLKATKLVAGTLSTMAENAHDSGIELNNRNIIHLRNAAIAYGLYMNAGQDFHEIPRQIYDAWLHAIPTEGYMENLVWQKIVLACVDTIESEIAEHKANAYAAWMQMYNERAGRGGQLTEGDREEVVRKLTEHFQDMEAQLRRRYPDDERVTEALMEMGGKMRQIIRTGKL